MMFLLVILLAIVAVGGVVLQHASSNQPARAFVPGLNPARPPMG